MSLISPVVSAHRVEAELLTVLETWTHTYLGAAERANGVAAGSTPRPQSYRRTSGETVAIDSHLLPRVVLRSSGWSIDDNDGESVGLALDVTVAGFWKGRKTEETLDRIRVVEAAIRTLLLEKGATGALIDSAIPTSGDYDVLDSSREETTTAFEIALTVTVPAMSSISGGPTTADPDPTQPPDPPYEYPDRPTAETVAVTTHRLDEE